MTATEQRRWQMTRVQAGDYLLPSNDGKRLWRISAYEEDGSLTEYAPGQTDVRLAGDQGRAIRGRFWKLSYFRRDDLEAADRLLQSDVDAFLDWGEWVEVDALLESRRAAIDASLRRGSS